MSKKVQVAETPTRPKPRINLDDKNVKAMVGKKVGDRVSFVVSGKIKSMHQYENEPANFSVELSKIKKVSGDRWGDYKKYLK